VTADSGTTNTVGWQRRELSDGIASYRLDSWSKYSDFLETEVFGATEALKHKYIWRGQRRSDWSLDSSLDRLFRRLSLFPADAVEREKLSAEHLDSFKYATRGRRGLNPIQLDENGWWALGQHFGLATPLVDWTRSPFAAAYFAFEEYATDPTEQRIVWGMHQSAVKRKSDELLLGPHLDKGRPPVIEFFDPMSNENPRLVSQDGLFTRTPIGVSINQWIEKAFEGLSTAILLRIEIPDSDRLKCLRALNRMNINHLSLFPDLGGASRSTNLKLELDL